MNQPRAVLMKRGITVPQGRRKLEQHLAVIRGEPAEQLPRVRRPDRSRAEAVAEKVEADRFVLVPAPIVLAVNDLRLRWMQFQAALGQASGQRFDGLRFLLAPAVHQPVIRIPTPWQVGEPARHPGSNA